MRLGEGEHVVEERRRAAKDAAVSAEDNAVAGEQDQVGVVIAEELVRRETGRWTRHGDANFKLILTSTMGRRVF